MLKKNLHLCFSGIHCLPAPFSGHHLRHGGVKDDEEEEDDDVIIKRFNSLYDLSAAKSSPSTTTTATTATFSDDEDDDPDFSSAFASRRFFVSSPGTSNSILDDSAAARRLTLSGGAVAVKKYSPDPYLDFRASMEEMLQAGDRTAPENEWEYMHELLLCYLSLNPKNAHKYIIEAFTDLLLARALAGGGGSIGAGERS